MSLIDARQRELATDPSQSYIVQAPAGSGKTEVLTQRYLRLLSRVSKPEEIICITFTKKAANEMRERILDALKSASNNIEPTSEHKKLTYKYATSAISRSNKLEWNILEQPNSLKIITIDSLCQTLANAIFIQESETAFADICTNPQQIYQLAARECLIYAAQDDNYKQDLQNLLAHVNNRQDNLLKLFADLLTSRDTWLEKLFLAKHQNKETFEKAIQLIEKNAIRNFFQCLDYDLEQELLNLIKKLYNVIGKHDSELANIKSFTKLNNKTADELCSILLTSNNKLRKSFDHHIGLKKGMCSDADYQMLKSNSKDLLEILNNNPSFTEALIHIKNLPDPNYSYQQWEILQSLFNLLPLLVANLTIIFNQNNQVDFVAVANEASLALGDDLNPTNLALYLDNKIQHILIDEFQDTSLNQFQLLSKLVHGWEENDGRTLFIVGDPQQSIYRFRGAEVGLFLKAKINGIANLKLTSLNLTCNFRSDGKIVNWVNNNFQDIFPANDNISSGAIKYSNSVPTQLEKHNSFIQAHEFIDAHQEAIFITQTIIKELQENPTSNIAILVRSRKQLTHILNQIREKSLPYQGVDIDLLTKQWHIRDLHSLTQALLMPANRLAWLSLLRSPFCGLKLEDILAIASYAPQKSIFHALTNLNKIENISTDGIIRTQFAYAVLNNALNCRAQTDTIIWLKATLINLQSEYILTPQQQEDLEQYWQLLKQFLSDGEVNDWGLLNEQLNTLYAKQSSAAQLQIMTIHKAKGLEFDCVIIPGLGAKSSNQDNSLFRTLNLPDENGEDIFLFSPIKAVFDEQCKLYNYLKKLDEQKTNYELQRLLYVAVTRAKTRLYLTDHQTKSATKNSFRSFLNKIVFENHPEENINHQNNDNLQPLYRLPISYYSNIISKEKLNIPAMQYYSSNESQRIIGIVTHELLQWICNTHPENYTDIPWVLARTRLLNYGLTKREITNAIYIIEQQMQKLYNDVIGRWIIDRHENENNEYEILVKSDNGYKTKILDRTFFEDGFLWIIDFKTGTQNQVVEKDYIKQVNEYAKALSHLTTKIKCGLYYLENNHWLNWQYLEKTLEVSVSLP